MSLFLSVLRAPRAVASVLGVALLASIPTSGIAQTSLRPVVVTGSREPLPMDRLTSDLVLIDAQRIRESAADSVEDLLRREAGVQVSRSGGVGQNATVLIRGAGSGNTVVLVDGVRVGSATLGLVEFEAISLSQIERIEVLRGPGSSLFGADGVGGVVQIFTRRGEGPPRVVGSAAVGDYGSFEGSVGVSGGHGMLDYAASLGRQSSRGVSAIKPGDRYGNFNPDNDGFARDSAQVKVGIAPVVGHRVGLNLVGSRLNAQFDSTEFGPQLATPDFRNKLNSGLASLDYRGDLTPAWAVTAQIARSDDDLKSGGTTFAHYRTQRDQWTAQSAWKPQLDQQLVLALEQTSERAHSDAYLADVERRNDALVLGYSGQLGAHVLQADLRQDWNSVYGNNPTARVGWSTEIATNFRARALAGTTFRAPSFNELFYPGYGVSTVTPERGTSIELGLIWRAGTNQAAVTLFENRVHDMIGFATDTALCPADPSYTYGCAHNIGRARLRGLTMSGSATWNHWRVNASVDLLDARDLLDGARLARRAGHQESLRADYAGGAWSAGAALLVVGSRPDGGVRLGGYATLDLRARWRLAERWQLEAKLLNATDRRYEPALDYQPMGRQAWIGVRFDSLGV